MSAGIRFVWIACFGVVLSMGMLTDVYSEERRLIKVGDPFPEILLKAS
ncbi:MAG: hypothetical protein JRI70_00610, partial [Deltaproteobacteria bacterium]|nr:hypothetical protein [Deltaproteobacteria bacterium]